MGMGIIVNGGIRKKWEKQKGAIMGTGMTSCEWKGREQ